MLPEIRETQKDNYLMVSRTCGILKTHDKPINIENKFMVMAQEREVGKMDKGVAMVFFLFCFVFCFLGPHPWHMEVPRLEVELELQLPAYTTATAKPHNTGSEPHLQPAPQLMPDPQPTE